MDRRVDGRLVRGYPKPEEEKAAVRAVVCEVGADILCLQEVGGDAFLEELRQDLRLEGLYYPHGVLLVGADPVRRVAVLSRYPWDSRADHAELDFPYFGGRERVKRGVLELRFVTQGFAWRLLVVHLKSPITERAEDPLAEQRRAGEARAVRGLLEQVVTEEGGGRFILAGDFNAEPESPQMAPLTAPLRTGGAPLAMLVPVADGGGAAWTHRWMATGRSRQVDHLLVSPELVPQVREGRGWIHDGRGALEGSDHRLVWLDLMPVETKNPDGREPVGVAGE